MKKNVLVLMMALGFSAIPYALNAQNGSSLDAADGDPADALFVYDNGYVQIGDPLPDPPFRRWRFTVSDGHQQLALEDNDDAVPKQWILNADGGELHITDQTVRADRISINSIGNVGIGSTTPRARLVVSGSDGYEIQLISPQPNSYGIAFKSPGSLQGQFLAKMDRGKTEDDDLAIIQSGQGGIAFINVTTGKHLMQMAGNGNVGIGKANPSQPLDVAGAVAVNGTRVIDGTGKWVGSPSGLQGPQGPAGPRGAQGLQGLQGLPGVHTVAVCTANPLCAFSCTSLISSVPAPCTVTSNTGSCNRPSAGGSCCVCRS